MEIDDNKALVQRFVHEIFVELNGDAVNEPVAPDFVSHTWGFKGNARQVLKRVTEGMRSALSDIDFDIHDLIAEDDRVAVRLTSSATQTGEFHGMWHQYDLPALMQQLQVRGRQPRLCQRRRPGHRGALGGADYLHA